MPYESVYIGAVLLSGGFALLVAGWLWSEDLGREATVFTAFMALHPIVAVLVAAELYVPAGSDLATLLYNLHNAVVLPVVPLWFVFAARYTDRRRFLTRPVLAAVGVWVVGLAALELTNPIHGILWTGYDVVRTPFPYVEGVATPLFGVLSLPQPFLNLVAMGVLAHRFLFGSGIRRPQTIALFVGFLPPWLVFGAWGAGVLPGPLNGWFVIGSTWSFTLVSWAIYRYQLFDLVPLARETVFEELDDPVIVVDDDGRLLDANRTAFEKFPVLADGGGRPLSALLPALANPEGSGSFAGEFSQVTEAGPREYTVAASTIDTAGDVRGHALVVRDVTERQQHVRDLEQQTAQLERFAGTLSHDIRNPLNVAQGWVDIAMDSGDTDDLGNAREALDRIQRIIEDMLTLTREGRAIEETDRVSLRRVFEDAWETTDTRDATFDVDDVDGVEVYAHASRLQNVFENLVRNAVEHGSTSPRPSGEDAVEHGGPEVSVTVGRADEGFYVEDDGPGIPPGDREKVFDYEYTTTPEGTGLGLAIVEAIAQAHGWDVVAEEGSAGGARIRFADVDLLEAGSERVETAT